MNGLRRLLFSLILIAPAGVASAQPVSIGAHWQFPNSGVWENATSWTGNMVPHNTASFVYDVSITDPVVVSVTAIHNVNTILLNQGALDLTANQSLSFTQSFSAGEGASILLHGGGIGGNSPGGGQFCTLSLANATVSGYGGLGSTDGIVRNFATSMIQADTPGQTLQVTNGTDPAGLAVGFNAGTMRAINGGTLVVFGGPVDNVGGTIRAELGSTVEVYSTIRGGTLAAAVALPETMPASGVLNLRGLVDGSANPVTINGNATLVGGFAAKGAISLNGLYGVTAGFTVRGDTVFSGSAAVVISGSTIWADGTGPYVFNLAAGITLRGYGGVGNVNGNGVTGNNLLLHNAGTISADVFNQTLTLVSSAAATNSGIIQAVNGGRIIFQGTTLDNAGGTFKVGDGLSTILLDVDVAGGTLDGTGTGTLNWRKGLDGSSQPVTIIGRVGSNNNSTLMGVFNNQGAVTIAQGTKLTGNTTFNGPGTVTLASGFLDGGTGTAFNLINNGNTINGVGGIGTVGAITLTNGQGATIESNSNFTIRTAGASSNAGLIRAYGGAGSFALSIGGGSTFANVGILRAEGGATLTLGSGVNNTGLFRAETGGKLNAGTPANLDAAGTLTGGTYEVVGANSVLSFSAVVVTLAATITIDGSTAQLRNSSNNGSALGVTTITPAGSLTLLNGYGTSFSSLSNAGVLRLSGGVQPLVFGDYTQTGGLLDIVDTSSRLAVIGALAFNGGTFRGKGTLLAIAVTAGTIAQIVVAPGESPGRLTVAANLTLGSQATLAIELGGTTQGVTYDHLNVTNSLFGSAGTVTLNAAKLDVRFFGGFDSAVASSDTFTFLTSASTLSGEFASLSDGSRFTTADGLGSFQINYTSNSVVLSNFQPVPEPGVLLIMGMLAVSGLLRRFVPHSGRDR
ncbi:hypothetical protein BH11PLA2_BH11PLA2_50780 [soil metagenome]